MRWSILFESGWFGFGYAREALLPALSLGLIRVSWVRGHLRTAMLAALRGKA